MQSEKFYPWITESIADSSIKVHISFVTQTNPDSLQCDRVSKEKNIQTPQEQKTEVPAEVVLLQNNPNPFNPTTVIRYQLPGSGIQYFVSLKVYDMLGREIVTVADGMKEAGYYSAQFDGSRLASGIYFARLTVQQSDGMKPIVLVKKLLLAK
jgi:hypothetical protein